MNLKEQYRRFRTWQKTPQRYIDKGLEKSQHCANCGHEYTGNYCPVCGQQAGDGRITWRWVWKSILDVWGMDSKSLPYTLLQLLLRPGYLIGDYISGRRQTCYKPVNMLFIVAIFYAIIAQLFGHDTPEVVLSTGDKHSILESIFTWLSSHPAWAAMSLTMIMILPTYFLFRFAPRHTRHTLPESIFIQLFMCTPMLICALLEKFLDWTFWLIPLYYYITYRQFFGYRPWGTIWRLLLSTFVWFFLLCTIIAIPLVFFDATEIQMSVYSLLIIGLLLLFATIPLAVGYWIGKKNRRPQQAEKQQ